MQPSKSCVLVCINNAGIQQRSKKADGRRDRAEVPCRGTVSWNPIVEPYRGAVSWSRVVEPCGGAVWWSRVVEPCGGAALHQ